MKKLKEDISKEMKKYLILTLLVVSLCSQATLNVNAAFLEELLPLEITTTTPTSLLEKSEEPILFSDVETITVAFSRAVIALGSDFGYEEMPEEFIPFYFDDPLVVGRGRWVTTSVYRWDPINSWPADIEANLIWNELLETYDGAIVNFGDFPKTVKFKTPNLSINGFDVYSPKTQNLTDNRWDASTGLPDDNLPEVPPDSYFEITFSNPVTPEILTKDLKIYEVSGDARELVDFGLKIQNCASEPSPIVYDFSEDEKENCVKIEFSDLSLKQKSKYLLVLPKGTKYSEESGELKIELESEFYGLRDFRLPFDQETFREVNTTSDVRNEDSTGFLKRGNITIWLPHGLSPKVTLENLKSALVLEQVPWEQDSPATKVDFTLMQYEAGKLNLLADLQPAQKYRLYTEGSSEIYDGYGLPLLPSSLDFSTSKFNNYSVPMHIEPNSNQGFTILKGVDKWDGVIPLLTRGLNFKDKDAFINVWSMKPNTIDEALKIAKYYAALTNLESATPDAQIPFPEFSEDFKFTNISYRELLDDYSGSIFINRPYGNSKTDIAYLKLRETDLQMTVLKKTVNSKGDVELMFWLQNAITGSFIENAKVSVIEKFVYYYSDTPTYSEQQTLDFIDDGITDADGKTKVLVPMRNTDGYIDQLLYWISTDTESVFYQDYYFDVSYTFGHESKFSFALDRAVVFPGDSLKIAGFGASMENGDILPYGQNPKDDVSGSITISPNLDPESENYEMEVPIKINSVYGTFQLDLEIPETAIKQEYQIYFKDESATFLVGEPRTPTAELTLTMPDWAKLNETVEVSIKVESLIGAVVADADITLTWTAGDNEAETVVVKTDEAGVAKYEIDLGLLGEDKVEAGNSLNVDVTYVGPTRERIDKSNSIRILKADKQIQKTLTLDTDLPNIEFGVSVTVNKVTDSNVKLNDTVQVELVDVEKFGLDDETILKYLSEPDIYPYIGNTVQECTLKSNALEYENFANCRMALPDTGRYALRFCLATERPFFCDVQLIGKNLSTWEYSELLENDIRINTFPATTEVTMAENLELYVDLPYYNTNLLVLWGNELTTSEKIFKFEKPGMTKFEIEIGSECLHGCSMKLAYMVPYQENAILDNIPKRISYDPRSPKSFYADLNLKIKDEQVPFKLDVVMEFVNSDTEGLVIAPGQSVTVNVAVKSCDGNLNSSTSIPCSQQLVEEDAEIVIFAVDKSYLQLKENPLVDISQVSDIGWDGYYFGAENFPNDWLSASSFQQALEIVQRRMDLDPWLLKQFVGYSDELSINFDNSDKYFLNDNYQWATFSPRTNDVYESELYFAYEVAAESVQYMIKRGPIAMSSSDESNSSALSGGAGASAAVVVRVQENFKVTPLFTVIKTDSDGIGTFNFTAPENIGTFSIRAYASTSKAQHGSVEKEIIVRMPLSLTPSAPRLARVGDTFEAGVIISVFGDNVTDVPVTITLLTDNNKDNSIEYVSSSTRKKSPSADVTSEDCEDVSCLLTLEKKIMYTDIDGQIEARFKFNAVRLGDANITIRADIDGYGDALLMTFPVYGQQDEVSIGTSFSVTGSENATSEWEEGLVIPKAVPGSGELELTAGVGRYPAVLQTAEKIMKTWSLTVNAEDALANISLPLVFQSYNAQEDEELYNRVLAAFEKGIYSLSEGGLTDNYCGLKYMATEGYYCDDTILNARGVQLGNMIVQGVKAETDILKDGLDKLKSLTETWRSKLIEQVLTDADEYLNQYESQYPLDTLSYVRLALGPEWSVEVCPSDNQCASQEVVDTLSMNRFLEANTTDMSVGARSRAAYTWLENGTTEEKAIKKIEEIRDLLRDSFRVTGRTAYIAETNTDASPANRESQEYALMVLLQTGEVDGENVFLDRLANYISSEETDTFFFIPYRSAYNDIIKMLSLANYDTVSGSADPDINLQVRNGKNILVDGTFKSPSDPVISVAESFDNLNSTSELEFIALGTGEVSLTASLKFVPSELLEFPTYRGIYVERIIRMANLTDGSPAGSPLWTVPLSSSVVITLQITTPDDLGPVTISALMPGGLEPVDPLLSQDSNAQTICRQDSSEDIFDRYMKYIWPICPVQETSPAVVKFKYSNLRAGTTTIDFQATSATVGEWILPPVSASADRQPEVMGLSSASTFKVCDGCEIEYSIEDKVIPKECSNNCSNAGVCDVSTGTCICNKGFKGDDCGKIITT